MGTTITQDGRFEHGEFLISIFAHAVLLLSSVVFVVAVIQKQGTGLWYDEIIVTNIGKLHLTEIIDTVKAEPHPLGFYLLVKILGSPDAENLRARLAAVSYSMIGFVILFGLKTKVIQEYKLNLGLLLFLSSPFWFITATSIKQDAITVPLLVLAVLAGLHYLNKHSRLSLFLLFCATFVSFLFGYVNFAKIAIILLYVSYQKSRRLFVTSVFLLAFVSSTYLALYGLEQYKNNLGRFQWLQDSYQHPINILRSAVGGAVGTGEMIFSGNTFAMLGLILLTLSIYRTKDEGGKRKLYLFLLLLNVVYFYMLGVARDRYVADTVFCVFILIGWQLESMYKTNLQKIVICIFLIAYLLHGFLNFYLLNINSTIHKKYWKFIGSSIGSEPTGIINRHPTETHIQKLEHFPDNPNAIPVSLYTPLLAKNFDRINKDLIIEDGHYYSHDIDETIERLKATGLNRFLYVRNIGWEVGQTYYDPNNNALRALTLYCKQREFDLLNYGYGVVFEDCGDGRSE